MTWWLVSAAAVALSAVFIWLWRRRGRTVANAFVKIEADDDVSTTAIGESTALPSSPPVATSPQAAAPPPQTTKGVIMIDVFGSGSYVAVLPAGYADEIAVDGCYSFNYQNGITTHPDGNTTWKLVAPLPVLWSKVLGLSYLSGKGVLCLYADDGMRRLKTKPGAAPSDDWKEDGQPL